MYFPVLMIRQLFDSDVNYRNLRETSHLIKVTFQPTHVTFKINNLKNSVCVCLYTLILYFMGITDFF